MHPNHKINLENVKLIFIDTNNNNKPTELKGGVQTVNIEYEGIEAQTVPFPFPREVTLELSDIKFGGR